MARRFIKIPLLSVTLLCLVFATQATVVASPGWVSPTGFVDGGGTWADWADGTLAYVQDTEPKEPFTTKIENNKYVINYSGEMVYVGKGTDTFIPEITMYRFGDECFLTLYEPTINGQGLSQKNASSTLTGDTIQWASKDIQFLFYPKSIDDQNDRGSFEYEITIANSKAGTDEILNNISFPIYSENLEFYYQPPLTSEEIAEGCIRPENVIGSYAVYHATKSGHILGQTNYMAGKAFHIYRPMLIDNTGDTAWADLTITDTNLVIDFSKIQDWLNKAKYPVAIDPDFGYMTIGSSHTAYSDYIMGTPYTSGAEGGVATSISFVSVNNEIWRGVIYKVSDNSRIDYTAEHKHSFSGTFNTVDLTQSGVILALTSYYLGAWLSSPTTIYYDTGVDGFYDAETYHATNPPPNPLVPTIWANKKVSIYCTYTPVGGANISNVPDNKDYGVVSENGTYETSLTYFTVTNNSSGAVTITIKATDFTGGDGWTLSDTATPGVGIAGLKAGLEGGDYTIIVKKTETFNTLVSGLAAEGTQKWGLKLYTPTTFSDGVQKSTTVTLTATLD